MSIGAPYGHADALVYASRAGRTDLLAGDGFHLDLAGAAAYAAAIAAVL
jgi:hypothetical protein